MAMKKKAVFFTLTTILLLSILVFYPMLQQYKYVTKRTAAAEERIYALNKYIENLERDTERGLYISSFRALYALIEYISTTGKFLNETSPPFYSAVMNGTIYNKSYEVLQDSTLTAWIDKIKLKGSTFHINTNIEVNNITLYQKDPWAVTVGVNLTIQVSDDAETAFWNRNTYFETDIPIK
jgi:hypothetical protein